MTSRVISSGFDQWAPTYDHSALQPAYRAAHAAVLREARRLVGTPARILDVGCGTGRLLDLAARVYPGAVLVGVDVSRRMLAIAGASGPELLAVQAAAEAMPFADGGFDLVVSTASVPHWTDPRAGMRELARVLAPGALLALADLGRGTRLVDAALDSSGLRRVGRRTTDGFGPVDAITVVLARRRARRFSWR